MYPKKFLLTNLLFILIFSSGCSYYKGASPGIYLTKIYGRVGLSSFKADPSETLIVAVSKKRSFIELRSSHVYHEFYKAITADESGFFLLHWPSGVVEMSVYVFSPDHNYHVAVFQNNVGVGSYEFNPVLTKNQNWSSHFNLTVKPLVSSFLEKNGVQLAMDSRIIISEWLTKQSQAHTGATEK